MADVHAHAAAPRADPGGSAAPRRLPVSARQRRRRGWPAGSVCGPSPGQRHPIDPRSQHRLHREPEPALHRDRRPGRGGDCAQLALAPGDVDAGAGGLSEHRGGGGHRPGEGDLLRAALRAEAADCVRGAALWRDSRRRFHVAGAQRGAGRTLSCGADGDRGAGNLDGRGDGARAVDAASDPRHPERPQPPWPWRARRHARPAGAGIQGPRQLVRCRERPAFCDPITGDVLGTDRLRVGDGEPRGCDGALLAAGRADLQQLRDARDVAEH